MRSKTCSTPRDLRYALAEADASFKSTMQARGTDWVALSNGRGQIARSPTDKEVKPPQISVWRHRIHHGYHPNVAPCRTKPAIARLPRTTVPRKIPLSSAAQLRAPPCLPHSTLSSSDVTRRKPPERAASRSTEDRESRSARLTPAVDREGHPAPQSRPERPRSREQEPRLTSNVRPLHWFGVACVLKR